MLKVRNRKTGKVGVVVIEPYDSENHHYGKKILVRYVTRYGSNKNVWGNVENYDVIIYAGSTMRNALEYYTEREERVERIVSSGKNIQQVLNIISNACESIGVDTEIFDTIDTDTDTESKKTAINPRTCPNRTTSGDSDIISTENEPEMSESDRLLELYRACQSGKSRYRPTLAELQEWKKENFCDIALRGCNVKPAKQISGAWKSPCGYIMVSKKMPDNAAVVPTGACLIIAPPAK